MPHKRPRSPYWQLQVRGLKSVPYVIRKSAGVKSKTIARQIEQVIRRVDEMAIVKPAYTALLDAIQAGDLDPAKLLQMHQLGRLNDLLRDVTSPPLDDVFDSFLATRSDRQAAYGISWVRSLLPTTATLSDLCNPRTITDLMHRIEQGEATGRPMKRNSVRRQAYRAVSLLLRQQLGNAERNRIMADVQFPAEDDRRRVNVSIQEFGRLLDEAVEFSKHLGLLHGELAVIIKMAVLTSADRGVLVAGHSRDRTHRGLRVRDVEIHIDHAATSQSGINSYFGTVFYDDRKAEGRRRTVGIGPDLAANLLPFCLGKAPGETVFKTRYQQFDYRWHTIRDRAGLPHLRFKDLRHLFFINAERAGIPLAIVSRGGGHSDIRRSADYSDFDAVFDRHHAELLEKTMGLVG